MHEDSPETMRLLARVGQGDEQALADLIVRHRPALRRFVELRLDARLNPRLDPSDVVQEAQLEVARRIRDYLDRRPMPFWLWLHRTAYENLIRLRRVHVEAGRRSVDREVALPDASSVLLARKLFAGDWPGQPLVDEEIRRRVHEALGRLDEMDREVLQLRAFEGLENDEVAQVLGLEPGTASKRYGRALLRLRQALTQGSPSESGS
ncbi:MAG TPA: sigma-70 family RNA polymerase sigma factor [Gemmataceae bacterium]|nr:sigma-70 family RNA polymerase sigma factor [Gemmataceae bacterium]